MSKLINSFQVWHKCASVEVTLDGKAALGHAADHERGGSDEIDGDHLDIDFTPTSYTPSTASAQADHVDDLAAHLDGIDDEFTTILAAISPITTSLQADGSVDSTGFQAFDVGIGVGTSPSTLDTVNVDGSLLIEHTATENDDHALEVVCDAAGYSDVKALDIDYITGAQAAGEDEAVILLNIDESSATGGDVTAVEVLATEGSASISGLFAGALVNPIEQLSGVFADMDSFLVLAVDQLSAVSSGGAGNVVIFSSDNDTITIGDAAKFEELEFLLATGASGAGIAPTFEYSTGVGTWGTFGPVDGTNGMRNTGVVAWLDGDIPSWATGTGSEYLIRITRTRNTLTTTPVVDTVQISAATEYYWDKDGDLLVNSAQITETISHVSLVLNTGTTPAVDWATGNLQRMTLTGNTTPTFSDPAGPAHLSMEVVQAGSGSYTVTWPAAVRWPGGTAPTLSTAVGAVDIIHFRWNGTKYDGSFLLNYS